MRGPLLSANSVVPWVGLLVLITAIGCSAFELGGNAPTVYNLSLLIIALAVLACYPPLQNLRLNSPAERIAISAALFFPTYVTLQLVPIPLIVLHIASPMRAEVAEALTKILPPANFAPLAIAQSQTWAFAPQIVGYVLIFLLMRAITRQFLLSPWIPALPLLLLGGAEALCGFAQHFDNVVSASGTYASRDHFAGLLEMILPFAVMYSIAGILNAQFSSFSRAIPICKTFCLLLLSTAIFVGIVFSLSKMGFFAALISLFIMGGLLLSNRLSGARRWTAVAGLAGAVFLAFFLGQTPELSQRFLEAASDQTGEGRFPIWKDSLHLIAAYPLFGCGLGNFYQGVLRYQTLTDYAWLEAHNDYLQLISELGIVGFLIPATFVIAVFATALRTAVRNARGETEYVALACVGSLSAILIHSFADFNMYIPANSMVFWWVSGIAISLDSSQTLSRPSQSINCPSPFLRNSVLVLGCTAAIYAIAWLTFLHLYNNDKKAERTFCNFGICDTSTVLSAYRLLHGGVLTALPANEFLEPLRRDPAAPYRWEDLGDAWARDGFTSAARYCYSRALILAPRIPFMLFRGAQFYFRVGENTTGLQLSARSIEANPNYHSRVFTTYRVYSVPLQEILQLGLPDLVSYQSFLHLLISQNRIPDAAQTWSYILAHNYVDAPLANDYTSFLLQNNQPQAAAQAWGEYAAKLEKGYPECNRIFNGGFESKPTGSPFDWSIEQNPGVAIAIDSSTAHSGSHALRIDFDGTEKAASIGLRQTVFLKPGHYKFQVYAKLDNIVTDQGIAFRIASQRAPNQFTMTTEPMLDSSDWKLIQQSFTVSPAAAGLAEIDLVRAPALPFPSLIRGTLWLDSVSIAPE